MNYDVFNGDADGICSLLQLRLNEPREAELITGVKRDIKLLSKISAAENDKITVLDISMDKNIEALNSALQKKASVFYVDHHFSGEIPESSYLTSIINEDPDVCTSILVNGHLKGKHLDWAVVGAFGDNLKKSATILAKQLPLNDTDKAALENLGAYINYNGYGSNLEDLHFAPEELYRVLYKYSTPMEFITSSSEFTQLEDGYNGDMENASNALPLKSDEAHAVFILPDQPWARRVSGVYSNDLTNQNPDRAHAVLTEKADGNYLVSVRAPLNNKQGAVDLCRQFPTGGGRAAAAGINSLSASSLSDFMDKFKQAYSA